MHCRETFYQSTRQAREDVRLRLFPFLAVSRLLRVAVGDSSPELDARFRFAGSSQYQLKIVSSVTVLSMSMQSENSAVIRYPDYAVGEWVLCVKCVVDSRGHMFPSRRVRQCLHIIKNLTSTILLTLRQACSKLGSLQAAA